MSSERLKQAIFGLCLLAGWSLLWLDSGLVFPFETGKAWVFRGIVELAFGLLLAQRLLHEKFQLKALLSTVLAIRLWQFSLLAFLLWSVFSALLGIDLYRSFWSNYERMSGLLAYLHWAMYLLCLIAVLTEARARILMLNLLAVIVVVATMGVFDTEKRIISTLGNPIYLGNLAVFGIFLSGYVYAAYRPQKGRYVAIFMAVLLATFLLYILIRTASRGPMVALLAGTLVTLAWLFVQRFRQYPRSLLLGVGLLLALIVGLSLGPLQNLSQKLRDSDSYALQRIGQISMADQTTSDRLQNWSIALDASSAHPLTGWGQDNYTIAFNEYYQAGVMDKAKIWFDRAHNAYLDVLLASGWPGLALYLLLLFMPIYLLLVYSSWAPMQKGFALGLLLAFLVKNLVGFDTFSSTLVWLSLVAVIWGSVSAPELAAPAQGGEGSRPAGMSKKQARRARKRQLQAASAKASIAALSLNRKLLLALLPLLILTSVYYLNVRPYQQNRLFTLATTQSNVLFGPALQKILALPPQALRYGQNAKLAILDMLLRRSRGKALNRQQLAQRKRIYQQAQTLVSDELGRQPRNARIRYNGALLMVAEGRLPAAIAMFEILLRDSPNRTVFWGTLAKLYAANGQVEKARNARNKQLMLNKKSFKQEKRFK